MRHIWRLFVAAFVAVALGQTEAAAVLLHVQGSDSGSVGHYRWLVEGDTTHPVQLNVQVPDSLGVSIHKGYAPVVAAGDSNDLSPIAGLSAAGRYFISILPDADYGMGGAMVSPGQSDATIVVNRFPTPTAQILVFVFEDNKSISGAAEIPAEHGLANFSIRIDEILGHQVFDVFGNPLGTTYTEPLPTDGSPPEVASLGNGVVTDANGYALVKNLPPGNYKVTARPQDGQPWVQTTAIGGGPFIPVVVKAGEPPFFDQGAGVLSMHVAHGFVRPFNVLSGGSGSITGRCVNAHSPHPPGANAVNGTAVEHCWVGLNSVESGTETGKYWAPANADGTFTISGVPAGTHQLALLDQALDNFMTNRSVTVGTGPVALGDVQMGRWTSTLEGSVFRDDNEDGMRQPGEPGIAGTTINLRYRDASIIQSTTTDDAGNYRLSEVPPLGEWTIAEVDYARLKATGGTFTADQGANLPPQVHTETQADGLILLEAALSHPDQISTIDWGKKAYAPGENGGIVGITYYAETRAEDDPYLGVGDPWEPGIPRVRVHLYLDANHDGVIDDLDGSGGPTLADVDNFPLDWAQPGGVKGPEDIDRNNDNVFDPGDAVAISVTDSFDDAQPTGCAGGPVFVDTLSGPQQIQDCAETLQTWNQLRPGVFDGGYYFPSYVPGGLANVAGGIANWDAAMTALQTGVYIVEAVPPPGYEIVKEEDKNVTIGDPYAPTPQALLFPCVGDAHFVLPFLSGDGATPGYYAGQTRRLCDRKQVTLTPGLNANADFFLFTHVPKAGRIVGEVQNALGTVSNPNNPNYGGPQTAKWMPISLRDYQGHEISRVYTDEYGEFNALMPSSYSPHVPQPSGLAPNVVTVCVNHPGPVDFGSGPVTDPQYDPNFDQPCLPVDVLPGKTTYVLMAVTAISAFTSAPVGVDCELTDGTPVISEVNGPTGGPVVTGVGDVVTITSPGTVTLPNPNPNGPPIMRDYGFGSSTGRVTVGGVELSVSAWTPGTITASIPVGGVSTGELLVQRADGRQTVMGVTLTVNEPLAVVSVPPSGSIQNTIDAAPPNALVLVPPGTYHENLIISKPVRLQGYGAWTTIVDGSNFYLRRDDWRAKLAALVSGNLVDLIPGQRADLGLEDGAGITVLGKTGDFTDAPRARIDGITVTGAIRGGGIFVNGHAPWLEISNTRLDGNQGSSGGGIRLGWQSLVNETTTGYESSFNENASVHHNHILRNGSLGDGGGLLILNGTHSYTVTNNRICGNYGAANGGAISQYGLSHRGLIADNELLLNDGFGEGGGISLIGEFVPAGAPAGFLSEGVGSVTIDSNLIQSNYGGDDGGGITMFSTNGLDVALHPTDPSQWWTIDIVNNIIVDNIVGFSGAGIAMSDVARVRIVHNTIANNDNTSIGNFTTSPTVSEPLAAGIIVRPNSPELAAASGLAFMSPELENNVIWHNRSFVYDKSLNGGLGDIVPDPTSPYWDLQVYGMPAGTRLDPRGCLLSDTVTGGVDPHNPTATPFHASNRYDADPKFVTPYTNVITIPPNALTITFEPLEPTGDYHLMGTSPEIGSAGPVVGNFSGLLAADFDAESRPMGVGSDIGADEVPPSPPPPLPSDTSGPKIRDLSASPNPTAGASSVSVLATAYDTATGGSAVSGAEYWPSTESTPAPGSGHGIAASYGSTQVALAFSVTAPGSDFTIFVRARDAFGNWGATASITVVVTASGGAGDTLGPSVNALRVSPNPTNGALSITLTATVVDTLNGNSTVDGAEYWTTPGPHTPGTGTPITTAVDGTFDESAEQVTATIPTPGTDFVLYLRGHDAAGNWGAISTLQVRVTPGNTGVGRGIFIQCPGDENGDAVIDAATTSPYFYPSNARCKSLSAGDGFINMGDDGRRRMYILGFSDLTGVPPDQAIATGILAANFPAPKIVVDEDDDFYLNLTNVGMAIRPDLFDPHSVHWHGFPNAAAIFDGLPDASVVIGMGSTLTYFYRVKEPGTYMYHCHVEAAEHMQMGMLGNLYVRPKQNRLPNNWCFATQSVNPSCAGPLHHNPDYNVNRNLDNPETGDKYAYDDGDGSTRYDVDYAIQIGSMDPNFHDLHEAVQPLPFSDMKDLFPMLNGRGYPDTINPSPLLNTADTPHQSQNDSSRITATPGQKILIRLSNLNVTRYYTLATLGIPMKVVGFNARLYRSPNTSNATGKTLYYDTNSVTLGGGETIDLLLDTTGVPNGTYFLYTTNLNYLANDEEDFGGMMTEITVAP